MRVHSGGMGCREALGGDKPGTRVPTQALLSDGTVDGHLPASGFSSVNGAKTTCPTILLDGCEDQAHKECTRVL